MIAAFVGSFGGNAFTALWNHRRAKREFMRSKLEELYTASIGAHQAFRKWPDNLDLDLAPFERMAMLAALYFPESEGKCLDLVEKIFALRYAELEPKGPEWIRRYKEVADPFADFIVSLRHHAPRLR